MMVKKSDIALPADPNDPEDFDVTFEGLESLSPNLTHILSF